MVVCKCRKATKLYCFVHKVPVCGDCVCHPEHIHCVVRTYSEWVIDGDYDWPPKCGKCDESLEDSSKSTTRLSCLHLLHTACLESHLQSYPPYTAPAGFTCPLCPLPLWPPRNPKDAGLALYVNLKNVISRTSVANTVLGIESTTISSAAAAAAAPPPAAFASPPLASAALAGAPSNSATVSAPATANADAAASNDQRIDGASKGLGTSSSAKSNGVPAENLAGSAGIEVETGAIDGPGGALPVSNASMSSPTPQASRKGAVPTQPAQKQQPFVTVVRKNSLRPDRAAVDVPYGDDDDASRKYVRRGPFYRPLLNWLVPFWSPALPTLPVTAPRRDGEGATAEELIDGRSGSFRRRARHQKAMDPRKMLLYFAILSCLATMMLLYYRLAQSAVTVSTSSKEHSLP